MGAPVYKHFYYTESIFLGTVNIEGIIRDLYFANTYLGKLLLVRKGNGMLEFDSEGALSIALGYDPKDEGFFEKAYLLAKEKALV